MNSNIFFNKWLVINCNNVVKYVICSELRCSGSNIECLLSWCCEFCFTVNKLLKWKVIYLNCIWGFDQTLSIYNGHDQTNQKLDIRKPDLSSFENRPQKGPDFE